MENTKQEERNEYIGIYVTPTVKKELEGAKDNREIQESIVKRFLKGEEKWLEDELRSIDDITIKYKAKLIGIKENFSKAQDIYVEEIEGLYKKVTEVDGKISDKLNNSEKQIATLCERMREIGEKIPLINIDKLERLIAVTERFGNMSKDEKELITLLVTKPI